MGEESEGSEFFTPGDPDGGVDCYEVFEDDRERCWQAKYFHSLEDSQFSQMDKSVRTALTRHPNLVRYIFCLPLNLADPRIEDRKYDQDRWNERVAKWKRWADEREMDVEFELWGESQLTSLLTQEKHRGRRHYWFNEQTFDQKWFEARLKEAIDTADDRYTPELHVQLNVAEHLDYFGRTHSGFERVRSLALGIRRRLRSLRYPYRHDGEDIECSSLDEVTEAVQHVLDEFSALESNPSGDVPIRNILDRISAAEPLVENARRSAELSATKHRGRTGEAAQRLGHSYNPYVQVERDLIALQSELSQADFQLTKAEQLLNAGVLVVKGEAGAGKTHLMCDFTVQRVEAGAPALLLMGQQFTDTSAPWRQMLPRIGMSEGAIDEFVGSLEEAGRASGCRALLLIDALNEGRGREIWLSHLSAFLARLAESKLIGVVLSVRTTYEEFVIPQNVRDDAASLIHRGFEGHEYEAARTFFERYGIEFQSAPILTPEYKNPLYLKTICRGLQLRGETRLPRGSSGITAAFQLFAEAVNERLADRLDYDRRNNLVRTALEHVATHFWETGDHWLRRQTAVELVDEVLPGRQYSRSLFGGLLEEGILSEDIKRSPDGDIEDVVYPSYERFGDLLVADLVIADYRRRKKALGLLGWLRRLLRKSAVAVRRLLGLGYSRSSTTVGGVPFLDSKDRFISLGVVEALCIEVPEQTGQELVQLAPEFLSEPGIGVAFEGSIIWRRLDAFTEETGRVWNDVVASGGFGTDPTETLLTVSAIPGHPFNAEFLDDSLRKFAMADRDARWTTQIHYAWGSEGPVDRLVDWARRVVPTTEVDEQVVDLSAVTLSWLFTSSNRFLRDAATRGLVSLLDGRLESARRLVNQFATVDDPYVLERVYAVAYGVSIRSRNAEDVCMLAQSVYDHVFSKESPPAHILIRDYARGVVERAAHLGGDLKVDMQEIRPPYRSAWPSIPSEEAVQELIERMDSADRSSHRKDAGWQAIESSVLHWDFARYIIGTNSSEISHDWLSIGINQERWKPRRERREELIAEFSQEEHAALDAYETFGSQEIEAFRAAARSNESIDPPLLDFCSFNQERDEAHGRFLTALSDEHRSPWQLLDEERPGFSLKAVQRYVLSRVLDLGWTVDRFGSFDGFLRNRGDYTRSERKAERIGKKYQWIAYHEVLAYIADHFQFCQDWGGHQYDGPWQIGHRDIDPSVAFNLPVELEEESAEAGSTWWAPTTYNDWNLDLPTQEWIMDSGDLPELDAGLVIQHPDTPHVSWICCYSFRLFKEPHPADQDRYDVERRETWFRTMACLVPKGMSDRFMDWVMSGGFRESNWQLSIPQLNASGVFLGEHSWSPASDQQAKEQGEEPRQWCFPPESDPRPAQLPVATHSTSGNGYDCSAEVDPVEVCLPDRVITEGCELTWSGEGADYVDTGSRLAAYDPSTHEPGPSALLIRSDVLENYLSDHDLELCWAVIGEKQTIGSVGQPYGWLDVRGAFTYRNERPDGESRAEYKQPSHDMSASPE